MLAAQILWSEDVDAALTNGGGEGLKKVLSHVENMLNILADSVLQEQPPLRRRKLEHLVRSTYHGTFSKTSADHSFSTWFISNILLTDQ